MAMAGGTFDHSLMFMSALPTKWVGVGDYGAASPYAVMNDGISALTVNNQGLTYAINATGVSNLNGRTLINGATDDTTSALQVNGNMYATGGTFGPSVNQVTLGNGIVPVAITGTVDGGGLAMSVNNSSVSNGYATVNLYTDIGYFAFGLSGTGASPFGLPAGAAFMGQVNDYPYVIMTNNTPRMYIGNSTGNVQVADRSGTLPTDDGASALQVYGAQTITDATGGYGKMFTTAASGPSTFILSAGTDNNFAIQPNINLATGIAFSSINDANSANLGFEVRASEFQVTGGAGADVNLYVGGIGTSTDFVGIKTSTWDGSSAL